MRLESTLKEIEAAYPGKVRIAYRHAPLPMHEHARMAARAAIAAQSLGRFWEFHDELVAHREALDVASLTRYASDAGIDTEAFAARLRDPRVSARLDQDELGDEARRHRDAHLVRERSARRRRTVVRDPAGRARS